MIKGEVLITSSPLLSILPSLSLTPSLCACLVLSSIQSREQTQTNAVIRLSDGAEEGGEQAPSVGPNVSWAAEDESTMEAMAFFILKNHDGMGAFLGGGVGGVT